MACLWKSQQSHFFVKVGCYPFVFSLRLTCFEQGTDQISKVNRIENRGQFGDVGVPVNQTRELSQSCQSSITSGKKVADKIIGRIIKKEVVFIHFHIFLLDVLEANIR